MLPSIFALFVFNLGIVNSARTTPTLNTVYPKPVCDPSKTPLIRYASTTERIYVESLDERGGCITVTDVWDFVRQKYPESLHPIDDQNNFTNSTTGKWLLNSDLYVLDGVTLEIKGSSVGGSADEFRLLSSSSKFVNLRAHGGSLDIDSTRIFSWDPISQSFDEEINDGRSYISCLSEVLTDLGETCDGRAKDDMGEGRMDITNSEISFLGYDGSESWGLSWKVRGFCVEKTNPEVFGAVGVFGNMYDSNIHHNYYGQYSYGHRGGDWSNNTVHDNFQYGFDPHDYSTGLTIHDNRVYNNQNHGIIASKWCSEVSIQGNEVSQSLVGIFLHLGGDFAIVKNNYAHDNLDAGITLLESSWATVTENVFERNAFGTRISVGSKENFFGYNQFSNNEVSVNLYEGNDLPQDLMTGRPTDNLFYKNRFENLVEVVLTTQNTDGLQFIKNTFSMNSEITLEDSVSVLFKDNIGLNNNNITELDVRNSCFDPLTDLENVQVVENVCDFPGKVLDLSLSPTSSPTWSPTSSPTWNPSMSPTWNPSTSPTWSPSVGPTSSPSTWKSSTSPMWPENTARALPTTTPTGGPTSGSVPKYFSCSMS